MGGFNLLEAVCRRLVAAGRQLLMGEKDKMHLKLMFVQPPNQLVVVFLFFSFHGLIITLSPLTTRHSGFQGLIQYFNQYGLD